MAEKKDELQAEYLELAKMNERQRLRIRSLKTALQASGKALKGYGCHRLGCHYKCCGGTRGCTCGFTEALTLIEKAGVD